MQLEPHKFFKIEIKILPCFVNSLNKKDQRYDDMVVSVGSTKTLPFKTFEQVPDCEYKMTYTVTTLPKAEKGGKVINYDVRLEGTVFGGLVKVNPKEGVITIDASDGSLIDQTF